jgi:predicted transcriptional regulator
VIDRTMRPSVQIVHSKLLHLIETEPGITADKVAERMNMSGGYISRLLHRYIKTGTIYRSRPLAKRGNGKYRYYRRTERGD